jgi:hypothetical protein
MIRLGEEFGEICPETDRINATVAESLEASKLNGAG